MRSSVILVDPGAGERRTAMLQALPDEAEVYKLARVGEQHQVQKRSETLGRWENVDEDIDFDLCLIHGGDMGLRDAAEATCRVWYSGSRGYDSRVTEEDAFQDEDQIWRAVKLNGDGVLSEEEAVELLEYVTRILRGEQPNKPPILLPPTEVGHLSALSLLCQGYLAVHASEHGGEGKMKSALDQMGWSEDLLSDGLDSQIEKVVKLEWWQVFDGEVGLVDKAKEEWGNDETKGWSTVEKLLDRVTNGDSRIVDDQESLEKEEDRKLVADAYCALAERLGGEPCP